MGLFNRRPWYVGGLAFECTRCGRCCAGPEEGYVWLDDAEVEALAEFLRQEASQVRACYVRQVGPRQSLVEDPRTKHCIFLTFDADDLARCAIYPVRPAQCRTWPFWPDNLTGEERWRLAGQRCAGIDHGPKHDFDEIQRQPQQTRC